MIVFLECRVTDERWEPRCLPTKRTSKQHERGNSGQLSCRDPSLAELADLPLGWYAERGKVGEPWVRRKHTPDDASE